MKINFKSLLNFKLKGGLHFKPESQHYIFAFLALFMLIVVSALVIWCVTFLVSNFAEAFTETSVPVPTEKFDIKGFEALDLVR